MAQTDLTVTCRLTLYGRFLTRYGDRIMAWSERMSDAGGWRRLTAKTVAFAFRYTLRWPLFRIGGVEAR